MTTGTIRRVSAAFGIALLGVLLLASPANAGAGGGGHDGRGSHDGRGDRRDHCGDKGDGHDCGWKKGQDSARVRDVVKVRDVAVVKGCNCAPAADAAKVEAARVEREHSCMGAGVDNAKFRRFSAAQLAEIKAKHAQKFDFAVAAEEEERAEEAAEAAKAAEAAESAAVLSAAAAAAPGPAPVAAPAPVVVATPAVATAAAAETPAAPASVLGTEITRADTGGLGSGVTAAAPAAPAATAALGSTRIPVTTPAAVATGGRSTEVLGVQLSRGAALASTGMGTVILVLIAVGLLSAGFGLRRAAR